MQQIENGIFFEKNLPGVTLGAIILPQGTLLIDAPLRTEDALSWKASMINRGRGSHRLLVVLDAHHDRNLGARAIEFPILAHNETVKAFRSRTAVFKGQNIEMGAEWERYMEVIGTRWTHPSLTFTKYLRLHWGDHDILIEHRPGPMSGAIWVNIPDKKIVFIGDAVTADQPPFLGQANIPAWIESLNLLSSSAYRTYTIISGRNGLITKDVVRAQRSYLKKILNRLEKMAQKEASIEAVDKIVPKLLSNFEIPSKYDSFYEQRLRYGLQQYYNRHYHPPQPEDE
ncbi:MAG: hypothetical protein PVG32_02290 [Anaerolineales bacterium]|jgi:glyoxylase-like metal-dependent hydrolase (beta-lactamase superfamily II)